MKVVAHKRIADIKASLGEKIRGLIEQGKLSFAIDDEWQEQHEQDGGVSYQDTQGLHDAEINFRASDDNIFSGIVKNPSKYADVYIDEIVEIPLEQLRHYAVYRSFRKSVFSKTDYSYLHFTQPIRMEVAGAQKTVAKLELSLVLPRTVCAQWDKEYSGNGNLRVHVKGTATLYGGYTFAMYSNRKWIEYGLAISPQEYQVLGIRE